MKNNIVVLGIGGMGSQIINLLYERKIDNLNLILSSSNLCHINNNKSIVKLQIGKKICEGFGTMGFLNKGEEAVLESVEDLKLILKDTNILFLCGGLGGGEIAGMSTIIKIVKEKNILVIPIVSLPLDIEKHRLEKALYTFEKIKKISDKVIVVDNNLSKSIKVREIFDVTDRIIIKFIQKLINYFEDNSYDDLESLEKYFEKIGNYNKDRSELRLKQ